MNSDPVVSAQSTVIEVECRDRWHVYHRLQDLDIPCQCRAHKALKVFVRNPVDALLLWSVVRHVTSTRQEQIQWLEACWQR